MTSMNIILSFLFISLFYLFHLLLFHSLNLNSWFLVIFLFSQMYLIINLTHELSFFSCCFHILLLVVHGTISVSVRGPSIQATCCCSLNFYVQTSYTIHDRNSTKYIAVQWITLESLDFVAAQFYRISWAPPSPTNIYPQQIMQHNIKFCLASKSGKCISPLACKY